MSDHNRIRHLAINLENLLKEKGTTPKSVDTRKPTREKLNRFFEEAGVDLFECTGDRGDEFESLISDSHLAKTQSMRKSLRANSGPDSSKAYDSALRNAPLVDVGKPSFADGPNIHLLNAKRAWRPQASGHSIQEGKLAALARDDSNLEGSPTPVPQIREAAVVGAGVQSMTLYKLDIENGNSLELFARAEDDSIYVRVPEGDLLTTPRQLFFAIRFGDVHVDLIEVSSDEGLLRLGDVTVRNIGTLIAKVGRDSGN